MPQQPLIDALEFAQAGASLRGSCAAADFSRLGRELSAGPDHLAYDLLGQRDARGRPVLRLRVSGGLQLVCQRCLGPVQWPVQIDATLVLATSQEEIDGEPLTVESPDRVLAGKSLPVLELIEDEVLLALPYAARHASCELRHAEDRDARQSPFAKLGALLGDRAIGHGKRGGKH